MTTPIYPDRPVERSPLGDEREQPVTCTSCKQPTFNWRRVCNRCLDLPLLVHPYELHYVTVGDANGHRWVIIDRADPLATLSSTRTLVDALEALDGLVAALLMRAMIGGAS